MKSTQFVKQILGKVTPQKQGPYLSKNEEWQDSLVRVMMTGILKNQFYRSADNMLDEIKPLMIRAAKTDPEFLLKAACFARDANMKGMVKLGIVALQGQASESFLNNHRNRLAIISLLGTFHPGQLIQFVELVKSRVFGRGFGARPQKWVRAVMENWDAERLETYTFKYPTHLNNLVRLVHPRYSASRGDIIKYILNERVVGGIRQAAVESMKRTNNSSKIAKLMLEHNIPWDVVKGFAGMNDPELCMAMMTQMGLSALLLNMRSLEQHGVFNRPEGLKALELKLDEVKYGRAIAIDFAKPYLYTTSQKVKNRLVKAMVSSLDAPMPFLETARVGVSVDISCSMGGEALLTAGLLTVPFLKAENLWFTTFDTALHEEGESNKADLGGWGWSYGSCPRINGLNRTEQVKNLLGLKTSGGTDVAISLREAIRQRRKLDLMVIVTDEQQNYGTPLMTQWKEYKQKINPHAKLWIVNASNYQWHSASFDEPGVTIYQTMTPAMFKNLRYFNTDLVTEVFNYDLDKVIGKFKVNV